jgi:hypothetical protein
MKRLTAVAPLAGALLCVIASSASASRVHVTGTQSPPDKTAGQPGDPCRALDPLTGARAGAQTMTGSMIGCWYTDTFNLVQTKPGGRILAIGTEHFVGCLDADRSGGCARREPHGTLALIFAFEGRFDSRGNELSGQCQHPIMSGTGGFKGARGRIDFTDNVATGTSSYRGTITLAKRSAKASASAILTSRSQRSNC